MGDLVGVSGDFRRIIRLDAPVEVVYNYFTDFSYVLPRLPEVNRVLHFKDGRYRMIFSADDGRGHDMGVVFDVRHEVVENHIVKMVPVPINPHELKKSMGPNVGVMFPGSFGGEATLKQHSNHCEIIYKVNLKIDIEVPQFLSFLPMPMLRKMGDGLMSLKLNKVGEGMSQNVPSDFKHWVDKNHSRVHHLFEKAEEKVKVAVHHHDENANSPKAYYIKPENSSFDVN
ncbi:DUF1997 domain-containing protein [Candidatus Chlorohelix sp.]|uniref:DUF1997 domain-containing protein n=1 Tax=Candidatus Chlorohelix sp. TaxID=3139201 RepID=UPI00305BBF87